MQRCHKATLDTSKGNLGVLRVALFVSLTVIAGVGGYFSYSTLYGQEERIEELSFQSTVTQIEDVSTFDSVAKTQSLHSIRSFVRSGCPTLESWPNCTLDVKDYNSVSKGFIVTADIETVTQAPLVQAHELESFSKFGEDFYSLSGFDDVAEKCAQGVFAVNTSNGERYFVEGPDERGENDFILPMIQSATPYGINKGAVMFNLYSGDSYVPLIDQIFACVSALNGTTQSDSFSVDDIGEQCAVVTKVIKGVQDPELRPAVSMFYPFMLLVENITDIDSDLLQNRIVIEVNNLTYVHVGLLTAFSYWDKMLTKSVPEKTNGLNIVLNDGSNDYCYTFEDGVAVFYPGKTTSKSYTLRTTFPITVTLPNSDFNYTLTITNDKTFSNKYYTNGPIFACILYLSAIFFCIFLYRLYDIQTTKKWAQNDQAKRNFVRYISHEIRTPLTTVVLGIKIVIRELKRLHLLSQPSSAIAEKALPHPAQVQEPSSSGLSSDKGHEDDASDDGLVVMDSLGMLESVEGSVEVAVLILTDLLNYDKIRSGRMDFTQEYLDMGRIVEEVGYSFQVAAQAAGVRVVVTNKVSWDSPALGDGGDGEDDEMDEETLQPMRKAAPALKVLGDRMKLQQVCRNMISNAVKFTQDGGLVSITIMWDRTHPLPATRKDILAGYVPCGIFIVTVQDDGVGISADNLKSVFSDGWQFNANMLQGGQGSGLGMWITKNITEMHQGTISVSSEGLGKGCTMRLELPALMRVDPLENEKDSKDVEDCKDYKSIREEEEEICEDDVSVAEQSHSEPGSVKRVLVVDDSTMCRKMVTRLLKTMSYEVVEATNGADCVEKLNTLNKDQAFSEERIDFVLLDYEMPILDGPSACKKLREQGFEVPIIGLTGNVLQEDIDFFVRCGANDVITKPFALKDFGRVIENY